MQIIAPRSPTVASRRATLSPRRGGACVRLVVAATLVLGGCSVSQKAALEDEPAIVTDSVTEAIKAEGIDSTDAEVIKTIVAENDALPEPSNVLAWSNPDTGNRGTIMALDRFVGGHGQQCKKFQTTVDGFNGISVYDGEACELKPGSWVLSWLNRN